MKNNSKTLTIETKKLWIIGGLLSFIASIYPSILLATAILSDVDQNFKEHSLIDVFKWTFPVFLVIFFLFVIVFILLCKWQSKKSK